MSVQKKRKNVKDNSILCVDVILIIYEYCSREKQYACRGISKIWRHTIQQLYSIEKMHQFFKPYKLSILFVALNFEGRFEWKVRAFVMKSKKNPELLKYLEHNILPYSKNRTVGIGDVKFEIWFLLVTMNGTVSDIKMTFTRKGDDLFNILFQVLRTKKARRRGGYTFKSDFLLENKAILFIKGTLRDIDVSLGSLRYSFGHKFENNHFKTLPGKFINFIMKMEHDCKKENDRLVKLLKLEKDKEWRIHRENTCKLCLWLNDIENIDRNGTSPEYYERFAQVPQ